MFRNYLLSALRTAVRQRLYSFINMAGLAIGLACAIFIGLFVWDELSYDRWIPQSRDLYRVQVTFAAPGLPTTPLSVAPFPLGEAMKEAIPEVAAVTRSVAENVTVDVAGRLFSETVNFVDPNYFEIFNLPMIEGSPVRALAHPESVVLSEAAARKYFGTTNATGRTIVLNGTHPLIVTAILKDLPHNTQLNIATNNGFAFISNKSAADSFPDKKEWTSVETFTYVRLLPGADPAAVVAKAQQVIGRSPPLPIGKTPMTADKLIHSRLIRFSDVHLIGDTAEKGQSSWTMVFGLSAVATLILLIACFNFTNLATARAMTRAREVGLRKVVGARRIQLVGQFLSESVLTALLALALALAIVEVLLPAYDSFLLRPLAFRYFADWPLTLGVIAAGIITGLIGGIYPAFVLSGFSPAAALKPAAESRMGGGLLRTTLVTFQFAISIALGIIAAVTLAQVQYARHLDLGFDRDNIVVISGLNGMTRSARDNFVQKLSSGAGILGVTQSSGVPFDNSQQMTSIETPKDVQPHAARILSISPEFPRVYGMRLLAGRLLTADRGFDIGSLEKLSDTVDAGRNILINEAAARELGYAPDRAVGATVRLGHLRAPVHIVGVVANVMFNGADVAIKPMIYAYRPNLLSTISVRIKGGHIAEALGFIDTTWHEFAPTSAINRHFIDDSFDRLFAEAEKDGTMLSIFVGIAIFIACLGLFGLAAFSAERRTKEIGIRKVMGAKTRDIVRLLLWQFSIPVLVANLIAWPVAWYYLRHWLEGYAYRIELNPLYFVAAGALALVIAWLTVIGHAVRVARANPVHALRYE